MEMCGFAPQSQEAPNDLLSHSISLLFITHHILDQRAGCV